MRAGAMPVLLCHACVFYNRMHWKVLLGWYDKGSPLFLLEWVMPMQAAATHIPYLEDNVNVSSMLLEWGGDSLSRAEDCIQLPERGPATIRASRHLSRLGNACTGCPWPRTPARRRRR